MAEKLDRKTMAKRRKFIKTGEIEYRVEKSAKRLLEAIETNKDKRDFSWFVKKEIILLIKLLLRYYIRLFLSEKSCSQGIN